MRNPDKLAGVDDPPGDQPLALLSGLASADRAARRPAAAPRRCCAPSPPPRARRGLPPPAALIGDWFGSRAVIAPSVDVEPVGRSTAVFDVRPGRRRRRVGGGWFGYLSYPDPGADGLGSAHPRGRGRLDGLRAAPGPPTARGGTKASPAHRFPRGSREALHGPVAGDDAADIDLARARPRRPPRRRAGLPGGDRRGRGVPGLRVHAVQRPTRAAPRSTSSSTRSRGRHPRGRRSSPANGARWRRCRPSCSCAGAGRR